MNDTQRRILHQLSRRVRGVAEEVRDNSNDLNAPPALVEAIALLERPEGLLLEEARR